MKFYKVSCQSKDHVSAGYYFFTSRKEADAENRRQGNWQEVETVEVLPTKRSILRALNIYGGHANNG